MSETYIVTLKNCYPPFFKSKVILSMNIVKIRLPDVQLILHPFGLSSVYWKCPIDCKCVRFYRLSETSPNARQQYDRSKNNLSHTHSELVFSIILQKSLHRLAVPENVELQLFVHDLPQCFIQLVEG